MKEIPLTKGKTAIVDDDDYEWLSQYKWHYSMGYAARDQWNPRKKLLMHRIIMNAPDGFVVDHIDGNTLNNQRSNLRVCTQQQNSFNRVGVGEGLRGVNQDKRNGMYIASIVKDYKEKHLGSFTNEIAAANCYNYWAKIYYGEFAKLNDVPFMEIDEWIKFKSPISRGKKSNTYTGVSYKKDKNKWKAYVTKDGKQIHIGYFNTEIDAYEARLKYIKNERKVADDYNK